MEFEGGFTCVFLYRFIFSGRTVVFKGFVYRMRGMWWLDDIFGGF